MSIKNNVIVCGLHALGNFMLHLSFKHLEPEIAGLKRRVPFKGMTFLQPIPTKIVLLSVPWISTRLWKVVFLGTYCFQTGFMIAVLFVQEKRQGDTNVYLKKSLLPRKEVNASAH